MGVELEDDCWGFKSGLSLRGEVTESTGRKALLGHCLDSMGLIQGEALNTEPVRCSPLCQSLMGIMVHFSIIPTKDC